MQSLCFEGNTTVPENVKIHEIAKRIGIKSKELVEICQRAGYEHIKHHSNAVSPEEAEEIRKTAIKKYRPQDEPASKPRRARAAAADKPAVEEKEKPVKAKKEKKAPPSEKAGKPPGTPRKPASKTPLRPLAEALRKKPKAQAPAETRPKAEQKAKRPRRRRPRQQEAEEHITKRTIVFKEQKRRTAKKKVERAVLTLPVTVRQMSEKLGVPASRILKELLLKHQLRANINQVLERSFVEVIALEHDIEVTFETPKTPEDLFLESLEEDKAQDLKPRSPVVALLGHVDHGKTTILDRIRNSNVAESEAGGITQDIGAWQTTYKEHKLTFIDTPGHEAFTTMRARGAQVTDIVILVVAADDGVMPQTEEAIDHARAAGVPIVVAINKVDKPDAKPMRVLQQLAAQELNPESWGGEVGCIELSALTGQGIDDLLERTILEAELLELKANPDRPAKGVALEARKLEGLGVVTNVIVKAGTLKVGDIVLCGCGYGRVKAIYNDRGEEIEQAPPSTPAAVSGLNITPEAGDALYVLDSLALARQIAEERADRRRHRMQRPREHVTLENLYERLAGGNQARLPLVLKADAQGSLEPLADSLEKPGTAEVQVAILHQGVGNVNESDVLLADASDAVIFAYRVDVDEAARRLISERGIQARRYNVIYEVIQDVRNALEGLLEPEIREEKIGEAEVRRLFHISRLGTVAGCYVTSGSIRRNAQVKVRRQGEILHTGRMASLQRETSDARQVESGYECGILVEGFNSIEEGDVIECYQTRTVARTLS